MRDLMESGAALLNRMRKADLARTVTYVRGDDSVQLAATASRPDFVLSDGTPVALELERRDYVFPTADLVLDDSPALPQEGDQIVDTINGVERTYEVMAEEAGTQPYRLAGPDQSILRVHTKLVA